MNDGQPLLRAIHVCKQYPGPAGGEPLRVLADVSLQVDRGGSIAIVGPSGCGKSTLLNILGALDAPTTGEVWCGAQRIDKLAPRDSAAFRRDRIGFIFQMHHLLPQCTAIENVLIPTLARGRAARDAAANQRAEQLLADVGLGERLHHLPGQLSGGECQRIAVVRALINEPDLILADEPTGSLDGDTARDVWAMLARMCSERQVALIAVTHARPLAEQLDRLIELRGGALADRGTATP
ncbi:MAG: ABC transporter ATP-binding protein [Phycisphaerales bacterium]|nr:ABC transporter ATP-binding protein [Phycisphaerales bacterium]